MKPYSLMCLLLVLIGGISVLAKKQICRCQVEGNDSLDERGWFAGEFCQYRFYCYQWAFHFYCEVTNGDKALFTSCCKDYGKDIIRDEVYCREIDN